MSFSLSSLLCCLRSEERSTALVDRADSTAHQVEPTIAEPTADTISSYTDGELAMFSERGKQAVEELA
jgi:hypothetical protein